MRKEGKKRRVEFSNVSITDTADEGLAIGKCEDGRIILVRGAVPGDIADVVVTEKRKGMMVARPMTYARLSDDRTDPFCSHFGLCGGCKWQHMTYAAQLRYKEKKVRDAFERIGGLDSTIVQPIIGAPQQQYYRNKLEYTASDKRWLTEEEMSLPAGEVQQDGIGFHLPGAFDKVVDIDRCYLQEDPSNDIRSFIKAFCIRNGCTFLNLKSKTGFLRNVIIRNTIAGEVMVVLIVGREDPARMKALTDIVADRFPSIVSVYSCVNTKVNDTIHDLEPRLEYGRDSLIETLDHVRFHIGPKSFFQTNSRQAATLYRLTRQLAALQPGDHVYDLYCGVGSLGIYMADHCRQVVGIEQIAEAISDAKRNAALNGLNNTQFVTGQVELLLDTSFIRQYGNPDVVITDPPRAGMHPDVVKSLVRAAPQKIVYVSCNPATQARDLKALNETFDVVTALPVDMFPQTHHIESIALLHRR